MALVSAMFPVAQQVRANRIVKGVSIPHPCGDPSLPKELDARLAPEKSFAPRSKRSKPKSKGRRCFRPAYREWIGQRDFDHCGFDSPVASCVKSCSHISGSPSFPNASIGNPGGTGTEPPIKTFGGDALGTDSHRYVPTPVSLPRVIQSTD